MCLFIAASAAWWGVTTYRNKIALDTAPTVEGVVLELHRRVSEDGTNWTVAYRFTPPNGQAIEHQSGADTSLAEHLNEGGSVTIRYLPSRPQVNAIDGNQQPFVWRLVLASVLALASLLVIGVLLRSLFG